MLGGHSGNSFGQGSATLLYQGHSPFGLYYRPLQPADHDALKAIHRDLFPIDYEEVFFRKAVHGEDRVFTWAAIHSEFGREYLVGFVAARLVYLYECDPLDRQVMGLSSKALDGHAAVYVLTLGVVASCRQCGIARTLLRLVHQHAMRMRCRAIFLHVISYNEAAMRLYGSSGYQPVARLPNFYHLITGRQPNPDQAWYDAFVYAAFMPSGCDADPSPAMQWAGGMLGAAVAPLRSMLGTFNGCMPGWLCRQTYSTLLPFANGSLPPRSGSKGSLADTATSAWTQPGAQTPPASPFPRQPHPGHHHNPAGTSGLSSNAEAFLQQQPQQPGPGPQQQAGGQRAWSLDGLGHGRGPHEWAAGGTAGAGGAASGTQSLSYNGSAVSGTQGAVYNGRGASGPGMILDCSAAPMPYGADSGSAASLLVEPSLPVSSVGPAGSGYGPVQRSETMTGPMLLPPSPLVPPSHASSMSSWQQRYPHGKSGPSTPRYTSGVPGAAACQQSPSSYGSQGQSHGHGHHHHLQHHVYHHQNHHHVQQQQQQGQLHGIHQASGSSCSSGNTVQGQAYSGRQGEVGRAAGAVQRAPHGLTTSALHASQHKQQHTFQPQQQQQNGSLLSTLFRPPSQQPHPHNR